MTAAAVQSCWKHLTDYDISLPENALAVVEDFQSEWCNGGFAQLFTNWHRANIVLIPEAMRIVGAPEAATIVDAAIAEFPDDQEDWRSLGHDAMFNSSSAVSRKLSSLDDAMGDTEAALGRAVVAFEAKLSEDDDL